MPSFPCGTIEIQGKGGIILYQIGEFIVKAANGVCEVKDLVHLDFQIQILKNCTITSNDPERLVGIIKLICDRKEERVRQGRKVTAVDGRYFKLAENLLYGELEVALDKDKEEIHRLIQEQCG